MVAGPVAAISLPLPGCFVNVQSRRHWFGSDVLSRDTITLGFIVTTITRFNLLATLSAGVVLAISVGYFFIYQPYQSYEQSAQQLRSEYIANYKNRIKNETQRIVQILSFQNRFHQQDQDAYLALHLDDLARNIHQEFQYEAVDLDRALRRFDVEIAAIDKELYFLLDDNFQLLSHSSEASFAEHGLDGCSTPREMVERLRAVLHAPPARSCVVLWPAAGSDAQQPLRVVHRRLEDKGWHLIVATTEAVAEKRLQQRFLTSLATLRFGEDNSGYFFVLDSSAQLLMVAALEPPVQPGLAPLPTPAGMQPVANQLAQVAQQGGGFYNYSFANPVHDGALEDKIVYVEAIPCWGWILGTGFYLTELDQRIASGQQQLRSTTLDQLKIGVLVLGLNVVIGLAIAVYTNRHVQHLEEKRAAHLRTLEQYRQILDRICLVTKGDLNGDITYANDNFCRVSGYTHEELLGRPHNIIRHPSVPKSLFRQMWAQIQAGEVWQGIGKNRSKNGDVFYANSVIMPLTDTAGRVVEYLAARYDITELLEKRDEIELAFATDSLTSLSSRHKLIHDINGKKGAKCLLLLDVDDFHGINLQLGIDTADDILRYISNQMVEFFNCETCQLYRLHSDIFAVLVPGQDSAPLTERCMMFFSHLAHHPFVQSNGEGLNLTLVAGVACDEDNLLNCADIALMDAKKCNLPLQIFSPALEREQERGRIYWINQVQQAIRQQRLIPYYQPIVTLADGRIDKYECLMRLIDGVGNVVPPGDFLPILEQTRYYPEMTRVIVEQACCFFSERPESFSINLSVDDLLHTPTVEFIFAMAKRYRVTRRLILEVVETENVQNYDLALRALDMFREVGMTIAIDDFGSGYANFSYLSRFPAEFVKLDGTLVSKVNDDLKTRNLVKTLIDFVHQEKMLVIAEYVSDAAILKTITELGCDYGQGFHLGRPRPAQEIVGEISGAIG